MSGLAHVGFFTVHWTGNRVSRLDTKQPARPSDDGTNNWRDIDVRLPRLVELSGDEREQDLRRAVKVAEGYLGLGEEGDDPEATAARAREGIDVVDALEQREPSR